MVTLPKVLFTLMVIGVHDYTFTFWVQNTSGFEDRERLQPWHEWSLCHVIPQRSGKVFFIPLVGPKFV